MKSYHSEAIRNVALLGHGGCGKTTFLEAALFQTGAISKQGRVDDGNTVSDYDKMEIDKGYSINMTLVPVEWKETKLNFIDTPGFFDFVGEVNAALRAAGAAVIMVDAGSGIQVGTETAWQACEKASAPRMFVISRRDKDEFDFDATLESLRTKFGQKVVRLDYPLGDELSDELTEAIAESDDELMEKYFDGEPFTKEEISTGLRKGIASGSIVPVCPEPFTISGKVDAILDFIKEYSPDPLSHAPYHALNANDMEIEVEPEADAPFSAFVFKTIVDPFVGKISLMKVITGTLASGADVYNTRAEKPERLGKLITMRGKEQIELEKGVTGDIVAVSKLQFTQSGDTLCDKANAVTYDALDIPSPTYFIAVEAADKNDEEKMGTGLSRLREEDPSFVIQRNPETHQTLIGGQGDIQLDIISSKLKDRFGVTINKIPQKIAYRETIKGESDVEGKHKKQTGGAGQYGDVWIKFSPSQQEFEFVENLFGGSVPKNYVPAVEKGLLECMDKGPLAGCKCTGIRAELHDGSYHPVDSNEVSFKIAASLAFKKGITAANPVLLEPIMRLEISVPDDYTGAVMGDMNKRRGRILGMEPAAGGGQTLIAEAPQAELFDYALALRSMTQGRGHFVMTFEKYEEVPKMIADKIIAAHQAEEEKA